VIQCRPAAALAAALLALAGCASPPEGAAPERRGILSTAVERMAGLRRSAPPERVALAAGAVVVVPPPGYCIDPRLTETGTATGFAALASCRLLTGGGSAPAVAPVLMTVTVGRRGSAAALPAPEDLARALRAPLLQGSRSGGVVLAHLGRGGALMLPGGDARHWRGAFAHGDRVVGLALYAPRGHAMAGPAGAALLQGLQARIAAPPAPEPAPLLAAAAPAR
jgi:hypothetical protein